MNDLKVFDHYNIRMAIINTNEINGSCMAYYALHTGVFLSV